MPCPTCNDKFILDGKDKDGVWDVRQPKIAVAYWKPKSAGGAQRT